jgi:formylglycine-generating enzyme required for sulfatase activity
MSQHKMDKRSSLIRRKEAPMHDLSPAKVGAIILLGVAAAVLLTLWFLQQDSGTPEERAAAELAAKAAHAEMVLIPAGSFHYGCNEQVDNQCQSSEKPGRQRKLAAFRIDRTEVTVAAYRACVGAGSCTAPRPGRVCTWSVSRSGLEQHPINCVNWEQARTYCEWRRKRLPSEQEWEKAARGTDGRKYPWGNVEIGGSRRLANIADESLGREHPGRVTLDGYDDGYVRTAPVGSYPAGASPRGVSDMAGNVWEWTSDWYDEGRAVRGGSWDRDTRSLRASGRSYAAPGKGSVRIGFRCAQ